MTKFEIETQKAESDKSCKTVAKLSGNVRSLTLNNLKSGDIITIPSDYKVFEQAIVGSDSTAEFVVAKVKRGADDIAVRFYPSSFYKCGVEVVKIGDRFERGEFKTVHGTVVDHVQNYATLDEAVKSIVDRPFRVNLRDFNRLNYESRMKTEDLNENDFTATHLNDYDFV